MTFISVARIPCETSWTNFAREKRSAVTLASGILAPTDSPIQSAKDLAGKTVAVNNLKSISDTTILHAVAADGGDPATVKFVEVAFPDMAGQLAGGNVDAAWAVEPFVSIMKSQGARVVDYNLATFDKNLLVSGYFTTTQYATENPDVISAFDAALKKSHEYATANPEELRTFLSTYMRIAPELQDDIVLPSWPMQIDVASIQKLADEGQKYGMTTTRVEAQSMLG